MSVLVVLYWIFLILFGISVFIPDSASPILGRGRWAVVIILFLILGMKVFGMPS